MSKATPNGGSRVRECLQCFGEMEVFLGLCFNIEEIRILKIAQTYDDVSLKVLNIVAQFVVQRFFIYFGFWFNENMKNPRRAATATATASLRTARRGLRQMTRPGRVSERRGHHKTVTPSLTHTQGNARQDSPGFAVCR